MSKFSVWYDYEEEWDPDDIAEPVRVCEAKTIQEAAESVANDTNDTDDNNVLLIVRDEESGDYYQIELRRAWQPRAVARRVTLAELAGEE